MERRSLPKKYRDVRRSLRVKRSAAGLGLYTEAEIEKGGFVIEYAGPIRGAAEIRGMRCKYLFETSSRRFVDGSPRWNLARYINHSCSPNCVVRILRGRIYVFAKRRICAGEELAYNYGRAYFAEFIAPDGCRCGKCIGTVSSV
ncbi:MAG: SET domain-containing protein [Kiritimatiellia bacterium]